MSDKENLEEQSFFETHYIERFKPAKNGSRARKYLDQSEEAKLLHENLLKDIFHHLSLSNTFGKESFDIKKLLNESPLIKLSKHLKPDSSAQKYYFNRHWYIVDIKDAYPSLLIDTLLLFLEEQGFPGDIIETVQDICFTPEGSLITGATCSPFLFNYYCKKKIDDVIFNETKNYNLISTRYFDDLVFSSQEIFGQKKRKVILSIIRDAGFRLNNNKIRLLDLARQPIPINGYIISYDKIKKNNVELNRSILNNLEQIINESMENNLAYSPKTIAARIGRLIYLADFKRSCGFTQTSKEKKIFEMYRLYKAGWSVQEYKMLHKPPDERYPESYDFDLPF